MEDYVFYTCLNAGITNNGSLDYGAIATSRERLQFNHFCTSYKCVVQHKAKKPTDKVLKFTSWKTSYFCPDCHSALFTKRAK